MIDHLDEGTLQALLDDELAPDESQMARRHLVTCDVCTGELMLLREGAAVLATAMSLLDESPKRGLAAPSGDRRRGWFGMAVPRAAALILAFASATAAAAFPFRGWIIERFDITPVAEFLERGVASTVEAPPAEGVAQAGVSVEPEAGRLRIVLVRPAPDLRIRARITDASRGGAYAIGESASARFATARGLVEVIEASGGELLLEIPSLASTATVELDGRLYLTKDGDHLRLLVAAGETSGAEVIFEPW